MRNLFRDTVIYGASAILSRGLALIVLPIYTRVLSPADYGALDMIMVAGTLAALIVPMEVNQAIARIHAEAGSAKEKRTMASTALWFTVAAYALILAGCLIAAIPLSGLLLGPAMEGPFRIGAMFIAMTGILYLLQNQLRVELRPKDYAVVSLVYATVTVSLGVLFAYGLGGGLAGVLLAQLAAAAIATLLGSWYLRRSFAWCFDFAVLREMLSFSLPLVPSGLATFLTLYANRLLLSATLGLGAVGLFGVAARIAGVVGLLTIGLQSSLTPLIYAHYKEPDTPARIAKFFETFVAMALFGALGLGLCAPEFLAVMAEPSYAPAGPLVGALASATLLSQLYVFFPGIAIARRTHLQLAIFATTGAFSLASNWLLIGTWGVQGAAVATLLSSLLFLVLWVVVSDRLYPLPVRWRRIAAMSAIFAALAAAGIACMLSDMADLQSLVLRVGLLALFPLAAISMGVVGIADLRRISQRIRSRLP